MTGYPNEGHKSGKFVYNYFRYYKEYHMEFETLQEMAENVCYQSDHEESYPSTKSRIGMSSYVNGMEMNAYELLEWARNIMESTT